MSGISHTSANQVPAGPAYGIEPSVPAAIEFNDITVRYMSDGPDGPPVLANVSLVVEAASFTAVVGPSGCGKTTLLRLASGLQQPVSGTTMSFQSVVTGLNPNVGYVTQESNLYPWLTAQENVEFGLKVRGVPEAERHARATSYLDLVGLTQYAAYYPRQLSGGMQKRVSLIRSLIYQPAIVLMDEPFSALDALTRMSIQTDLETIWEEQGDRPTVIFVTHDLTEAIALSDKVVVMSARPSVVLLEKAVQLPRPRDIPNIRSQDGFDETYDELWAALRQELDQDPVARRGGGRLLLPKVRPAEDGVVSAATPDEKLREKPGIPGTIGSTSQRPPQAGDLGRASTPRARWRVHVGLPGASTLGLGALQIAVILAVLGAWQLLSAVHVLDELTFSNPVAIAKRVVYLLGGGLVTSVGIYPQIETTLREWALGYAIGGAAAIMFGFALGRLHSLARVMQPLILIFYGIPVITIAPLFILILGIGVPSKVAIGCITAFFAIFFQVFGGAAEIPEARIQLARLMGAKHYQVLTRVLVPSTLPAMFLGLRMAVPFTMTGVIIGEFVAAGSGLGWFVTRASAVVDAPDLFATLFIIVLIVWLLGQIVAKVEGRVLRWLPDRGMVSGTGI